MKYGYLKKTAQGKAIISIAGNTFLIMPNYPFPSNIKLRDGEKVAFDTIGSAIPGRSFAKDIRKPTFAEMSKFTANISAQPVERPLLKKTVVAPMVLPSKGKWDRKMHDDYDLIKREVLKWGTGGYWYSNGPTGNTVYIELPIRSKEVRKIYEYLKAELMDHPIPKPPRQKQLFHYVTALNYPKGKSGFRITGHSYLKKDIAKKKDRATYGVLHIDSQK